MATVPEVLFATTLAVIALLTGLVLAQPAEAGEAVLDYDLSAETMELRSLESHVQINPPDPDRCCCLARDGKHLWVGTTAGAVRWNLADGTRRLFKADPDWGVEFARKSGVLGEPSGHAPAAWKTYLAKWVRNAVEDIILLTSGNVWVETYNGAMVIRGEKKQVFASKEQALAALHRTGLKPTLAKIVAMDKAGHLWRTHQIGESFRFEWGIRRFDGAAWTDIPQPGKRGPLGSPITCIVADRKGNLWACGWGGIYRRGQDRWVRVNLDDPEANRAPYSAIYVDPSGTLWAFGMGLLVRFDGKKWSVFRGRGRYEDFQLDLYSAFGRKHVPVLLTPDGKLWFSAAELGLIRFDGETFRAIPKITCITAIATGPEAQTFISTGQRIFRYDKGKWQRIQTPDTPAFRPPWPGGAEGMQIYDLCVAKDNTLYLAGHDGLWQRRRKQWKRMLFAEGKHQPRPAGKPELPDLAQAIARPKLPSEVTDQLYQHYVTGPGRGLVKATDQQLAADITEGPEPLSALISYHRLHARNAALANKALRNRIRSILTREPKGEPWLTQMELAALGPAAVKSLLELAKAARGHERTLALEALAVFPMDAEVAQALVRLAEDPQIEGEAYLAIARGLVMAGKPEGIDLLIKAATTAVPFTRGEMVHERIQVQRYARQFLQEYTRQYDDLPDDWSGEAWLAWWKKHRSGWKAPVAPHPIAVGTANLNQAARKIARRLETRAKPKPSPAAK